MNSKLRNSLLGLSAVFAFVIGGAFFGEPLRDTKADVAAPSPEARIVLALLNATVSVAQAQSEIEAAEEAPAAAEPAPRSRGASPGRHSRRLLSMPYFSFASVLPRAPQES